jgi:hypothetical protein
VRSQVLALESMPTLRFRIELFGYDVGRVCERRPRKIIVDEIGYLKAALAEEKDERQRENIAACLEAVEMEAPRGERYILWE